MTFTSSAPWATRSKLPKISAVYGLHDGQGQLLYVGQTINLQGRLIQHHRAKQVPADGEVRWLEVEPALLDELERRLIAELAPPLNGSAAPLEDRVSWVIPRSLRQAIAKVAAQSDRTISAEARVALAAWCRQHGIDPDAD